MNDQMRKWRNRVCTALTLVLLAALAGSAPAALFAAEDPGEPSGSGVQPIWQEDNPNCQDIGYDYGFKPLPEPPMSGTYTFPDGVNTVTITAGATLVDWNSTLSIDAVIVKGGPNANLFVYDPEGVADTLLHAPVNPDSQALYDISHIEFCYDLDEPSLAVDVVKNAAPACIIEPSGTAVYSLKVTNSSPDGVPLTLVSIEDDIYGDLTDLANTAIFDTTCQLVTLAAGQPYECSFKAEIAGPVGNSVKDVVTVTATDAAGNEVQGADDATVGICAKPPYAGVGWSSPAVAAIVALSGLLLLAVGLWLRRRAS